MRYILILIIAFSVLSLSCNSSPKDEDEKTSSERIVSVPVARVVKVVKLTSGNCIDPDLSLVSNATQLMLCDGTIASGTYTPPTPDFPEAANVLTTDTVNGTAGTYIPATPNEWDVRYGVVVGSTTGKLKVNCRNMVGNWDGTAHTGGSSTLHTIDDYNAVANGFVDGGDFPSTNPWGSNDAYFCGFNDPTERTWELVDDVTAGVPEGDAIYRDKISGLKWTRGATTVAKSWSDAITYCSGLTHGSGGDTWRLPTQKELMAAYEHGIHDLDNQHADPGGNNLGELDSGFWSSSTVSWSTSNAWSVNHSNALISSEAKTASVSVLCVAP